jgi:hypothetical protein
MGRSQWLNPARGDYQVRRWARRQESLVQQVETTARGPVTVTPDPGSQTEMIRVDPSVANVAYVTTSVPQPYGGDPLVLYPSSLVRPDLVNPGVVYLTVTDTGP